MEKNLNVQDVVSVVAKGLLSMLKAVPGLNVAAAVLNAAVAGVVTAVIGEIAIAIMEKILERSAS